MLSPTSKRSPRQSRCVGEALRLTQSHRRQLIPFLYGLITSLSYLSHPSFLLCFFFHTLQANTSPGDIRAYMDRRDHHLTHRAKQEGKRCFLVVYYTFLISRHFSATQRNSKGKHKWRYMLTLFG